MSTRESIAMATIKILLHNFNKTEPISVKPHTDGTYIKFNNRSSTYGPNKGLASWPAPSIQTKNPESEFVL